MAIETPIDVLKRLRETRRQEQMAQRQAPRKDFTQARTGKQQATAFGGQIGIALAQAFSDEPDHEQSPEVIQARRRAIWMGVAPDDVKGLKAATKAAYEAQDYDAGKVMSDRYIQAEKLRLARDTLSAKQNKDGAPKRHEVKHWPKGVREDFAAISSQIPWVQTIDDDDAQEKVANAINAKAEDIWNAMRTSGADMSKQTAYSLARASANRYYDKGFWGMGDSFNFEGFADDQTIRTRGVDYGDKEEAPVTKTAPRYKVGDIKDGYRLIRANWKDKNNWKPIDATEDDVETKAAASDDSDEPAFEVSDKAKQLNSKLIARGKSAREKRRLQKIKDAEAARLRAKLRKERFAAYGK